MVRLLHTARPTHRRPPPTAVRRPPPPAAVRPRRFRPTFQYPLGIAKVCVPSLDEPERQAVIGARCFAVKGVNKKRKKQVEADTERRQKAAEEAAARVAVQDGADGTGGSPAGATGTGADTDSAGAPPGPEKKTRRSAPCWQHFSEVGAKEGHVHCTLAHPKKLGQVCNEPICVKHGPTGMWNHLQWIHPDEYIRCRGTGKPLGPASAQPGVLAVPADKRDELHKAHARWLVKSKRPLSLPEGPEYRDIWTRALHGAYTPPDATTVRSHMLQLSGEGRQRLVDVNTALHEAGIKPCGAGDIWSDRGVSLLGICEYYINQGWEIVELVCNTLPPATPRLASPHLASPHLASMRNPPQCTALLRCWRPRPSLTRATQARPLRPRPTRRSTVPRSSASSTSASFSP